MIMYVSGVLRSGKRFFLSELEEYINSIKPDYCSRYGDCEYLDLRVEDGNFVWGCKLDICCNVDYWEYLKEQYYIEQFREGW